MSNQSLLFQLRADSYDVFDGSAKGTPVKVSSNVKSTRGQDGLVFRNGFVQIGRSKPLDELSSFTISATIRPERVDGQRKNILEGQSPAIALYIDGGGQLVGSVHTANGWTRLNSGNTRVQANRVTSVRFTRDAGGKMNLYMDGNEVAEQVDASPIQNVGDKGFVIGAWVDNSNWPFAGTISDVQIRSGVMSDQFIMEKRSAAKRIEDAFKLATGLNRVIVNLLPDESHARLQPIKDILNAAGVSKLSDLDTLQIVSRTVMDRGKVMIASRKSQPIRWADIAKNFAIATRANSKRELLATHLTNRNSNTVLKSMQATTPLEPARSPGALRPTTPVAPLPFRRVVSPLGDGGRIIGLGDATRTSPRLSSRVLRNNPTIRMRLQPGNISELFRSENNTLKIQDADILNRLEAANPAKWPVTSEQTVQLYSLNTIPVDSAVIIAGILDLTDKELLIEPDVTTLYIIAEKIIAGNNAKISWRRPSGTTPARAGNPDLDGRGYSGVQTKPNSRDGLDGEDGRAGQSGISGAPGRHGPNLEIWVKDMSAMPNLDLNGEDGIKAGRGQRGGRGGDGADGHVGKRVWFFGYHCTSDPGDGGDGGDGGNGGRGGKGGNGGNGGSITIGVLDGTLEATVTGNAFRIKNQGGQRGRGGDGGEGGNGGHGGRSGVGETCHDAENGHNGAKGQPGAVGADASHLGFDGEIEFFEFTQEGWDDLLTRPWLNETVPSEVFPGDSIILRGSRFSSNDRVIVGSHTLVPTINADESITVTVPMNIAGGDKPIYVRRQDGTESNRRTVWIKPQLATFSSALAPGTTVTLSGRAFLGGASVLVDGASNPATLSSATQLTFDMPGTGGIGTSGGSVTLQVRNPDGMVSNSRMAQIPRILEIPFRFGSHNLSFSNFRDGVPDWGTYEDTFGTAEVWHELLDPVFGHPILTAAFYGFYHYFLKGETNGGLATGFCTSLASLVADRFWQGHSDTPTIQKGDVHKLLTAVHGKLLSRESLIHFHDQSRDGISRVEQTYREIEVTFLRGCDRNNMPILFFIHSGAIWDEGYIDGLSDSHCVMPYRFMYPVGRPAPQLTADSTSTSTNPHQVELYVWDCNHPNSANCRLVFTDNGGRIDFEYFADSTSPKFSSQDGVTLGMMTNGKYLLSDHDLPFSGPFGLTRFVIDFLLSPADLQITDANNLRTGNFGGQIMAEIPDSHPCYLMKGMYLLPENSALTRRIVGNGTGSYTFNSVLPDGLSLVIENVSTIAGQEDVLSVSSDATQIRFTPGVEKTFSLTLARQVDDQVRALAISGMSGGPASEVDLTVSPELSLLRMGNRGAGKSLGVRAFVIDKVNNTPANREFSNVNVPTMHDLTVAVPDWNNLDVNVQSVSFE